MSVVLTRFVGVYMCVVLRTPRIWPPPVLAVIPTDLAHTSRSTHTEPGKYHVLWRLNAFAYVVPSSFLVCLFVFEYGDPLTFPDTP